MKYAFPLAAVIALVLIALVLVQIPGMQYLFGVVIPYLAMALFLGGFCYRVVHWAKSPVPFKIPTTCGQGYSLPWIKQDKLEAPVTTSQVVARMFLEIFLFRSLWRNTKATVKPATASFLNVSREYPFNQTRKGKKKRSIFDTSGSV